jgi:hypothetical protein
MTVSEKIALTENAKSILHENCIGMIKELQDRQTQLMDIYKNNSTYPLDFYVLSMRENDTKVVAIRELYKRITDEEL